MVHIQRKALRITAIFLTLLAAAGLMSRTVFAKNTYVITDGNRVFAYESYATDPVLVLEEAGLALTQYDTYTAETGEHNTALTVCRSQTLTVDYHGQRFTVASQGETVRQLLTRLNIYPEADDVMSAPEDALTYDGMQLQIQQIFREEQTYIAAIPHETNYYYSDALPRGMEQVMTEGRDGELLCSAQVTYINGVEHSRKRLSQQVITNPITEVIAVGTGLQADGTHTGNVIIEDGIIILPTGEKLTYTGTMQVRATGYTHTDAGCDMITATGTTVRIGTVAVDPRYIPYGTRMFIVSNDGSYIYGISVAEDCGGAIKGDRVDLYFPTTAECFAFGRRGCTIYFLG